MGAPPPSRRLVSSAPATLLLLSRLLLAGASDGAPPLVGVSPQNEAYFAPQVIACRDGSGYFPRNRLNEGYCDCADGTDEPGTSACPEGKFYCRNIGDTPRLLFSSFVNDKICASLYLLYEQCYTYNMAIQLAYDPCSSQLPSCGPKQGQVFRRFAKSYTDCCDGSDEYESGIHCQNTCRNRKDIAEADDGGRELSVTHLDVANMFTSKHTIDIEDLIQKLRGLKMALVIELGLVVCIFAFCFARRHTRTHRRQYVLKR